MATGTGWTTTAIAWVFIPVTAAAQGKAEMPEPAKTFFARHCLSCHGADKALAGFRIDRLDLDFSQPKAADAWKEVLDRVNVGEMPPREKLRPSVPEVSAFADWVNDRLREVALAAKNAGGRIPMRRLNRDEFANTVRDLLRLDERIVRSIVDELPGDGKAEGFDRLGVALFFDQTQIERTLSVAEKVSALALPTEAPKAKKIVDAFGVLRKKPPEAKLPVFPGFTHVIPRGAEDRFVRPEFIEVIQGGPTYRRETAGWGSVHHFAIGQVVTQDGYYRVRIKATVDPRGRTEPNRFRLQYAMESPIQAELEVPLDPSGVTEATMFLHGPSNGEVKGPQVFRLLWNHNENAVVNEPAYKKLFSRWTQLRGQMEQAAAKRAPMAEMDALKKKRADLEKEMNAWTGPSYVYNPEMDVEKLARLRIASIEIEGPIQKEWPPPSQRALFGDVTGQTPADVRAIFARFLPRAYRRPVTDAEVDAIAAIANAAREKLPFPDAMRVGLARVLCSPHFLFLGEPSTDAKPRPLNDHEFATRLSYFLWSTMPDADLSALASADKLREPAVVAQQVTRMLDDPRADQFVRNFAGQWLSVRDYGSVQPAADYKNYDKAIEAASKEEPFAFFAEVLAKNLPITAFLDSDFLVVNERLAKHYGIAGVEGSQFRRVAIRPEHHRGGVLGMAGLMTYLADGTRTLPMRRGTWVLRELLGDPPNDPPPNAGEIQPNAAGKNLTVRERLDLHRRDAVCASCHAKLDPYGLALENYDAIGQWRERANGEGFRGPKTPLLDVSGAFPDGTRFATLAEYKAGLMAQKDRFARTFATKLLTYALCRPVGYADREQVDRLAASLRESEYRLRPLIAAIVTSDPFRHK